MRMLSKAMMVLSVALLCMAGCGGGDSSTSARDPQAEKTFSLQLESVDVRDAGTGEALAVDASGLGRDGLTAE